MSVENCIDQLSASQYISVIPRIVKPGKFAEEVKGHPPQNSIRYLDHGMVMTFTTTAPGTLDHVITKLDLMPLGLSPEMSKKKSLHYVLQDCPAPGWTKEISVRSDISVKSVGQTSVRYTAPDGGRILRSKVDAMSYLAQNKHLSRSVAEELDFRSSFCVCHGPEDSSEYMECACGLGGCNHWFHARCVGMSAEDVAEFKKVVVVCPLCVLYLETTGNAGFLLNKWVLRVSPSSPTSYLENIFRLPTAEGTVLQRRESAIYVNGLVFKPSISWKPLAQVTGINFSTKGRKRKAKGAGLVGLGPRVKYSMQTNEETPHSMLNEDDFLQLEAFLSPCEDPIMSIGGTIINSNDEDEVSPSTCKDTSQRAARRKQEGDSSCEYEDSGDDVVEESSFEVAEDDDDEEY